MTSKHIHQYEKRKLGKSIIYKCILKGCPHFVQKTLVENRLCICYRCGNVFTITKKTLRFCAAKPHCENCYHSSNANKDKVLDDLIETLIGD